LPGTRAQVRTSISAIFHPPYRENWVARIRGP
jgi:hypothetical protein